MRHSAFLLPLDKLKLVAMTRQDSEELRQLVMKRTFSLVFPAFLALTATGYAADVRVIDSGGVEVLVRDIAIDYSGLLGSDKETEGLRVSQGEASVTAKWADIPVSYTHLTLPTSDLV